MLQTVLSCFQRGGGLTLIPRKIGVTVYVRHRGTCPKARYGEFYTDCDCAKWLRFSVNGRQHRQAAGTRSWITAKQKALELEQRLELGESNVPVVPDAPAKTILDSAQEYIAKQESRNLSPSTIRRIKYPVENFEQFMLKRSKFYPNDITTSDLIEYRASWKFKDQTKRKEQVILRSFLKFCCKGEHRVSLLDVLDTIKESKESRENRKPKPLSETEIHKLLQKIPDVFTNPDEARRFHAMIRVMLSTGLAIIDTVQLERAALEKAQKTGVLKIERQKTGKPAIIPIDGGLLEELLAVLNGHPKFVFWRGTLVLDSEITILRIKMRKLMKEAGVYVSGNVFHRFRDTAVDFWVGKGWSMSEIADALGDTIAVVENHYRDWASERTIERMARLPVRKWEPVITS